MLSDHALLDSDRWSGLDGSPLVWIEDGRTPPPGSVAVLVDRTGALPCVETAAWDALITTAPDARAPWVSVPLTRLETQLRVVASNAAAAPVATALLARTLRLGEGMAFEDALEMESLAYSTLLSGDAFRAWRAQTPRQPLRKAAAGPPVRYERVGEVVTVTLDAPGQRNAMTADMRDALYDCLYNVLIDPSRPRLVLRGAGRCFSTGGALDEFGQAGDLAAAHVIRTQRSVARLLHRLGERASAALHGACIGSGIEVAAAAGRRVAAANFFMQLPELRMGLIPGAGGTVTLSRAIGRHRLMWLILGAFRLDVGRAAAWGLVERAE